MFFLQNAHLNDLFLNESKEWAFFYGKGPKFWNFANSLNWLWQELQLVFQKISSITYGFRVKLDCSKKSLKIPKGQSESVYRRRTDNTMAKRKGTKDKQWSTKHTYKIKDRVTRTPLKTGGELRCSGRISSSCSTSGTRHVNLVTNPVISREWGKDREVFATSGTYPWSFVTQIFHICRPSHGCDHKIFEVMTST